MPFSAGVKERYKKKLRIRMDIRKAAKAATAVSPEGSDSVHMLSKSLCEPVREAVNIS